MIRRVMAGLGLLAFTIAIFGGVYAGNTFEHTLIRALEAMAVFCGVGVILGWFARIVLNEHRAQQRAQIFGPERSSDEQARRPPWPGTNRPIPVRSLSTRALPRF